MPPARVAPPPRPPGAQSRLPGDLPRGKEERKQLFCRPRAFLCPVSFQRRWQVSAFLHLWNWKEAIGDSFDFQWQLRLAGHRRAQQAKRKHLQTKTYFFPRCFSLLSLRKSNARMRAMTMCTLRVPSRGPQPGGFQGGKAALEKGWWCSPGALPHRRVAGVPQNRRDPFQGTHKHTEPISNGNDGKTGMETSSRVTAKPASPASNLLTSRVSSIADEPSSGSLTTAAWFSCCFSPQLETQPDPRTRSFSMVGC